MNGLLWKSTNGGKEFESIELPNPWYGRNFDIIMYNKDIGIIKNAYSPFTKDGWKSMDSIGFGVEFFGPLISEFKNDSIVYFVYSDLYDWNNFIPENLTVENIDIYYFGKYNLNSKKMEMITKLKHENNSNYHFNDIIVKNDTIILIGHHSSTNAPSSVNTIIKSVDGGKTWKTMFDVLFRFYLNGKFYSQMLSLRNISFKNDSVGIAVGQFGKVLYTYDAGSSWYLEMGEESNIDNGHSILHINYESGDAILTVGNTTILKLREDNLAPQPQDTFYISGYILEGNKPQKHIPIALDNRITITDENGFYEFTKVRGRTFELKPLNKHFNYTPYIYSPDSLNITINKDTVINFQAIDNTVFHNISGNVYKDWEGLPNIPVVSYNNRVYDTVYTNEEGFYHFDNIEEGFNYSYKPISDEYKFNPEEYSFGTTGDRTGYNFHATPISSVTQNPNFQLRDNVLISEEVAGINYRIISLSGRVVKSAHLPKELNLNAYPTGTYILHITKGEQIIFTHKFQVVR